MGTLNKPNQEIKKNTIISECWVTYTASLIKNFTIINIIIGLLISERVNE